MDVDLAVIPLDEGCPLIGHAALAVIPGGADRVRAVLGPSYFPHSAADDSLRTNNTENKRDTQIADSFRKWSVDRKHTPVLRAFPDPTKNPAPIDPPMAIMCI